MREFGRLQGHASAELAQVLAGDGAHLRVDELGQALGRAGVAAVPGVQQAGDRGVFRFRSYPR